MTSIHLLNDCLKLAIPLSANFPFQTPYLYASNNPVRYIDYMGLHTNEPKPEDKPVGEDEETKRARRRKQDQEDRINALTNSIFPRPIVFQNPAVKSDQQNRNSKVNEATINSKQNDVENNGGDANILLGGVGVLVSTTASVTNEGILNPAITNLNNVANEFPSLGKDVATINKLSKYGKFIKWAGWAGTATSVISTEISVRTGEISRTQGFIEQGSNAIGAFPLIGTAWTAGWWLGKTYGISKW